MATILISYDLLNPEHVNQAEQLQQDLRGRGIKTELLDVDRLGIQLNDVQAKRSTPAGAAALAELYAKAARGSDGVINFEMADAMALTLDGPPVQIRDPRAAALGRVTKTVTVYLGQSRVMTHKAKEPGGFNAEGVEDKNLGTYTSNDELADRVEKGLRWLGLV
jgi:hypothetical protein